MRKILHTLYILMLVLWRKYILRRKPLRTLDKEGRTETERLMGVYQSVQKLVDAELMEVDVERGIVFLGRTLWEGMEKDAKAFMGNVCFYINFRRNYVRGMMEEDRPTPTLSEREGEEDSMIRDSEESRYREIREMLKAKVGTEERPMHFLVAVDDEGSEVYKVGAYANGKMSVHLAEPEKYPREYLMERMERIRERLQVKS